MIYWAAEACRCHHLLALRVFGERGQGQLRVWVKVSLVTFFEDFLFLFIFLIQKNTSEKHIRGVLVFQCITIDLYTIVIWKLYYGHQIQPGLFKWSSTLVW